ncbi:MAG: lysophospholipid acyltransferase family protein [Mycobacteriales bacterium]
MSAEGRGPVSPRRDRDAVATYRPLLFAAARAIGRVLFPVLFRIHVRGAQHVPRAGAAILAGNHRGALDGPLVALYAPRRARFIAKSELFTGAVARLLGALGQIPIDRGRPDRRALRDALAVLASGNLLGMFPEGTRGTGDLASIQHGIGYVALRARCPIVPVACVGSERALPKGARAPRWGSRVTVVFGPPFMLAPTDRPRTRAAVADAAEEIRAHLAAHVAGAEDAAR